MIRAAYDAYYQPNTYNNSMLLKLLNSRHHIGADTDTTHTTVTITGTHDITTLTMMTHTIHSYNITPLLLLLRKKNTQMIIMMMVM